jgi:hypothetical protein
VESGRPVSTDRAASRYSWFQFAIEYTDLKWNRSAATSRRTDAEALSAITMQLFSSRSARQIRSYCARINSLGIQHDGTRCAFDDRG